MADIKKPKDKSKYIEIKGPFHLRSPEAQQRVAQGITELAKKYPDAKFILREGYTKNPRRANVYTQAYKTLGYLKEGKRVRVVQAEYGRGKGGSEARERVIKDLEPFKTAEFTFGGKRVTEDYDKWRDVDKALSQEKVFDPLRSRKNPKTGERYQVKKYPGKGTHAIKKIDAYLDKVSEYGKTRGARPESVDAALEYIQDKADLFYEQQRTGTKRVLSWDRKTGKKVYNTKEPIHMITGDRSRRIAKLQKDYGTPPKLKGNVAVERIKKGSHAQVPVNVTEDPVFDRREKVHTLTHKTVTPGWQPSGKKEVRAWEGKSKLTAPKTDVTDIKAGLKIHTAGAEAIGYTPTRELRLNLQEGSKPNVSVTKSLVKTSEIRKIATQLRLPLSETSSEAPKSKSTYLGLSPSGKKEYGSAKIEGHKKGEIITGLREADIDRSPKGIEIINDSARNIDELSTLEGPPSPSPIEQATIEKVQAPLSAKHQPMSYSARQGAALRKEMDWYGEKHGQKGSIEFVQTPGEPITKDKAKRKDFIEEHQKKAQQLGTQELKTGKQGGKDVKVPETKVRGEKRSLFPTRGPLKTVSGKPITVKTKDMGNIKIDRTHPSNQLTSSLAPAVSKAQGVEFDADQAAFKKAQVEDIKVSDYEGIDLGEDRGSGAHYQVDKGDLNLGDDYSYLPDKDKALKKELAGIHPEQWANKLELEGKDLGYVQKPEIGETKSTTKSTGIPDILQGDAIDPIADPRHGSTSLIRSSTSPHNVREAIPGTYKPDVTKDPYVDRPKKRDYAWQDRQKKQAAKGTTTKYATEVDSKGRVYEKIKTKYPSSMPIEEQLAREKVFANKRGGSKQHEALMNYNKRRDAEIQKLSDSGDLAYVSTRPGTDKTEPVKPKTIRQQNYDANVNQLSLIRKSQKPGQDITKQVENLTSNIKTSLRGEVPFTGEGSGPMITKSVKAPTTAVKQSDKARIARSIMRNTPKVVLGPALLAVTPWIASKQLKAKGIDKPTTGQVIQENLAVFAGAPRVVSGVGEKKGYLNVLKDYDTTSMKELGKRRVPQRHVTGTVTPFDKMKKAISGAVADWANASRLSNEAMKAHGGWRFK